MSPDAKKMLSSVPPKPSNFFVTASRPPDPPPLTSLLSVYRPNRYFGTASSLVPWLALRGGESRPVRLLGSAISAARTKNRHFAVDSELTCPVLVAHQMSASSGSVLLWDCGQRLGVVPISTGTPPSGFKRRFSHPGSLPSRRTGRCSAARGRGHGIRRDRRGP